MLDLMWKGLNLIMVLQNSKFDTSFDFMEEKTNPTSTMKERMQPSTSPSTTEIPDPGNRVSVKEGSCKNQQVTNKF